MPLGLAKDSMLNLAELAHQKELEEAEQKNNVNLELGADKDEDIVMEVATGEIKTREQAWEDAAAALAETGLEMEDQLHQIIASPLIAGATDDDDDDDDEEENDEDSKGSKLSSDSLLDPADPSADKTAESLTTQGKRDSLNGSNGSANSSVHSDDKAASSSATPAAASPSSYGQYSGFSADYPEYQNYDYHATYAPILMEGKRGQKSFWCCLFPWMNAGSPFNDENQTDLKAGEETEINVEDANNKVPSRSNSKDDDEVASTGSDVFGEKLSDKDRQAVLARLRLAQPDISATQGQGDQKAEQKGLLNGIMTDVQNRNKNAAGGLKGILKNASSMSRTDVAGLQSQSSFGATASTDGQQPRRRSLFPQYEPKEKVKKNLKAAFAPMARVVTVKSKNDMDEEEKGDIWWQKQDYEEFRKTGRLITQAMLEGGSEIWLASSRSWQEPGQNRTATLKNALSLSERQRAVRNGNLEEKKTYEETRDKWWHKFGHSRRGLEHIASIDEGRQRQTNVKTAIRAVLDEQRRQKVFHREDPEKLRIVSIQHTSWARDLALAAGASDADAVRANFDERRKSREFYLLKFSRSNSTGANAKSTNVPAFMQPMLSMSIPAAGRLDANTTSQIRYRQTQQKEAAAAQLHQKQENAKRVMSPDEEVDTPIKDESYHQEGISMAKRAAGFSPGEDTPNMSAVLSGMGPVPKSEVAAVGGP